MDTIVSKYVAGNSKEIFQKTSSARQFDSSCRQALKSQAQLFSTNFFMRIYSIN